jgi:hypothetical protein
MMGTRLGVRAPCGQRVRAPRVKNGLISCSWLHLLKVWSLLKIRGDSLKVIRCVFGDRDRRRLSTYHTVLRVAIADKWAVVDVASKIGEYGGVQEISLGKKGGMSAKDKANAARAALMNQDIASVSSDALSKQFNTEHIGENAVAVLTLNSDGTYSVHCVVRSATAVNAALAGYFSQNKEVLKGLQEQQQKLDSDTVKAELIVNAATAANDFKNSLAA